MTFSAIIFDCDGVLVDSEKIYLAVEREHLVRIGLEYDQTEYRRRFMGLNYADYFGELEHDYRQLKGTALPADFSGALRAECARRLETELQLIEGADALLERYAGARAVASSSTPEALQMKLRLTDLHHHFDPHIYSGDEVENGKPAPDLFLMAASKIGIPPAECLVVEDSENGVRAGLAAGMTVWGFTGGGHADESLAERLQGAGAHVVMSGYREMQEHAVS
ncbi:MAG: HAD family hydrolase [Hyphomicrobiales bacterium]|nr:HAD family hydrolase [Hyphomicrobiales bacterium]MCP4997717.1 HAD family hydrolase [Hyphomicrobiales bacterium]